MDLPLNWSNPDPLIIKAIRRKYPDANLSAFYQYTSYAKFDFMSDCTSVYGLTGPNIETDYLITKPEEKLSVNICEGANTLDKVMFWIALSLGLPGNILALITILRMAKSTGTFYVALLSASDLFTVIMKSLVYLMREYRADSDISCKLNYFLVTFAGTYANWVLVLICFERFVTIRFPLKKSYYFTMRRAQLSAVLLAIFLAPMHGFHLFLNEHGETHCQHDAKTARIMSLVVTLFYSYLPTILMLLMVTAIAMEIKKIQRNRKAIFGSSQRSAQAQSNLATQQKLKEQAKVERSITGMLVVASIVFVILTLPICVIIPIGYFSSEISPVRLARFHLAFRIATNLVLLSHGVNFFLYFVSAGRFRAKLYSLLKCTRAADGTTQEQSANTMEESL